MSKSATTNRRTNNRRKPRSTVRVACAADFWHLGSNTALALLDVSESGIRLLLRSEVKPGQELQLTLSAPAFGKASEAKAHVVWCVPAADGNYCVGAVFRQRLTYAELQRFCL